MVYLFTTNMYDFDWFGWGDLLLVLPSVSSVIQCFFMFDNNITDDDNAVFYLYSKILLFPILALFSLTLLKFTSEFPLFIGFCGLSDWLCLFHLGNSELFENRIYASKSNDSDQVLSFSLFD